MCRSSLLTSLTFSVGERLLSTGGHAHTNLELKSTSVKDKYNRNAYDNFIVMNRGSQKIVATDFVVLKDAPVFSDHWPVAVTLGHKQKQK
jgi:endonuclease/exonuclease/phosphatase family metal-dependent hydrolase